VLGDLLDLESQYLFKKVQLSQLYMEAYEHCCDSADQQRLMRAVVDLTAKRPRLSLDSLYFRESYNAELAALDAQLAFFRAYNAEQVDVEKAANSHLHDSMALGHRLAQLKHAEKWNLANPDEVITRLVDKFESNVRSGDIRIDLDANQRDSLGQAVFGQVGPVSQAKKEEAKGKGSPPPGIRYADEDIDGDAFTKLLDLPKVTVRKLFQDHKDHDDFVDDVMAEHAHFIQRYEGYPDLMSVRQSGRAGEAGEYKK
jgi:hypothetical protein